MIRNTKILDSKKILAKNLKNLRLEQQVSLEHISTKTRLEITAIKRMEEGLSNPSLKEITKLAVALDVPVHTLLSNKK